jgi:UDP-N-acetyl-D-glucosamine dehydrogenase
MAAKQATGIPDLAHTVHRPEASCDIIDHHQERHIQGASAGHLLAKLVDRSATVGVVGLGYVGLPATMAFAEAGYSVIGIDIDADKVRALQRGESYVQDVESQRIQAFAAVDRLLFASHFSPLEKADVILITVPTPITNGAPDLSMVTAAGVATGSVLTRGTLVVLESTTYPGTTEELLRPLLEASGLTVGVDFHLAFSPERIDPGNPVYSFEDIPKVVGGCTTHCTDIARCLYEQVVAKVVTVPTPKEAELAKLIENTFRHVNIGLINELAIYAHEMEIDIWEALAAAATKPFGYMPFWPSPGWGGHCIPLDPSYLSWRVRRDRSHEVRFVELAQAVNAEMPGYVVQRMSWLLNDSRKAVRGANVMVIGVAYKSGIDDTRESPALRVMRLLMAQGANLTYHDPLVPHLSVGEDVYTSSPLTEESLMQADMVLILVPQVQIDWGMVAGHARLVLDCCNAIGGTDDNIIRL